MATYDILQLGDKLLESFHISSVYKGSDGGNAIFHNIPEIIVNRIKVHAHLVLLVVVVCPIEGMTPSRDLYHARSRHN